MRLFARLLPGLVVAMLTVLAALPWGLGAGGRILLPMLPFTAIAHWSLARPESMPAALVFVSGLSLDALTYGPLGYWAAIFLLGHLAALALPRAPSDTIFVLWPRFALVVAAVAICEWSLASAYFIRMAEVGPRIHMAVVTSLIYLPAVFALLPLDRIRGRRRQLRLERGG